MVLGENTKRYIIRTNRDGHQSVWIPVETTMSMKGFDAAWDAGAEQYYHDVEVGLGQAKGWVRVVEVGN